MAPSKGKFSVQAGPLMFSEMKEGSLDMTWWPHAFLYRKRSSWEGKKHIHTCAWQTLGTSPMTQGSVYLRKSLKLSWDKPPPPQAQGTALMSCTTLRRPAREESLKVKAARGVCTSKVWCHECVMKPMLQNGNKNVVQITSSFRLSSWFPHIPCHYTLQHC